MSEYLTLKQDILTRVDEFDFTEQLKPSAIMQYFQDVATTHAEELGVGFSSMKSRKMCWVISRMSISLIKSPKVGDRVIVQTYPRKPSIVDAIRDYWLYSNDGEILAKGTSKWCVLDFENRAIRRVAPLFNFDSKSYYASELYENGNVKLDELNEYDSKKTLTVQITDLDRNLHMNNAKYGDMIYNCMSTDFLSKHRLTKLDMNFLMELKEGEQYYVTHKTLNNTTYYQAKRDDATIFRAKAEWNKVK